MMAKSAEQKEEARLARLWLVAGGGLLLALCCLTGIVYASGSWLYESFGSGVMLIAAPMLMLAAGAVILVAVWCFVVGAIHYFSSEMAPR